MSEPIDLNERRRALGRPTRALPPVDQVNVLTPAEALEIARDVADRYGLEPPTPSLFGRDAGEAARKEAEAYAKGYADGNRATQFASFRRGMEVGRGIRPAFTAHRTWLEHLAHGLAARLIAWAEALSDRFDR